MTSFKDIGSEVRFIVLLHDVKMKLFRINKIISQPESTVYDWKDKLQKGINFFEHQAQVFFSQNWWEKKDSIIRQAQLTSKLVSLC